MFGFKRRRAEKERLRRQQQDSVEAAAWAVSPLNPLSPFYIGNAAVVDPSHHTTRDHPHDNPTPSHSHDHGNQSSLDYGGYHSSHDHSGGNFSSGDSSGGFSSGGDSGGGGGNF